MEGRLDLTYRCNFNCRHCWLRISPNAPEKKNELSLEEIKGIVDQASAMGCRRWSISGGEPMLRPDFSEIFDYVTRHSSLYSLNTNGSLITLQIARLMQRKGRKMVSLYGATADVHDHITRVSGSFEATLRGFNYLKKAGAEFIVQLIPMKDNHHQFQEMVKLAESLSKHHRIGAPWLYLSACGSEERNAEIVRQRLPAGEMLALTRPDVSSEERTQSEVGPACRDQQGNGHLLSTCIAERRSFHVDPYGKTIFCCFIKDPALRYDLRRGSLKAYWEEFLPSLAGKAKVTETYKENCGSCELRQDCQWCPAFGYLEHGNFGARVEYLCEMAGEKRRLKENWQKDHQRHFKIADITIEVESDLPFSETTFHSKFDLFKTDGPGADTVSIRHHFSLPDLEGKDLGREVYRRPPWVIYEKNHSWVYAGVLARSGGRNFYQIAAFDTGHTRGKIFNEKEKTFRKGNLQSLTLFPSDQILLARLLADRQGFYLHSCGMNLKGQGLLFAGNSEAGKSTVATMLKGKAEILCDDRIIVRKRPGGFRIYGTWNHGDVPDISSGSAPLKALMFLEKAGENRLTPLSDKKETTRRILGCLVRPFVTVDWWEKTLGVIDQVAEEIPCYELRFDRTGGVADLLESLVTDRVPL